MAAQMQAAAADIHAHRILILDFGAQYTQLIARRVREIGVYCEILPWDCGDGAVRAFGARGIILSGGPESVTDATPPRAPDAVFELGVPVLGICYGMQTMAAQLGGRVAPSTHREFGYAKVRRTAPSRLLDGIDDEGAQDPGVLDVWMSHGDRVEAMPPGSTAIAATNAPLAAMANDAAPHGGQFHPEVTHTRSGGAILERFVRGICSCDSLWDAGNIVADVVTACASRSADRVLLGLSGGVDSAVAAALIHKAIGDQLTCIFVDTGLLRLNEGDQVMETFARHLGVKVDRVNAADEFFAALGTVADPEEKRKIIGRLFVDVFQREAKKLPKAKWLAQGTIYPDVIESAGAKTKKAVTIKSHHNVGGLPESLHQKLLEPLRELFKYEVRLLGIELGLPREMVFRHPFPGPGGLGVRILGEVRREYAELLRRADAIFIDELRTAVNDDGVTWYDQVAQAFAVFLPVRSVGVMGDGRTYEHVVALRAVATTDFMTADWAELPHALLGKVSSRIINEVRGINRVVYDVSSKPPATIEWE
jgi:GMP synthase (glutamine-hydrolysing)